MSRYQFALGIVIDRPEVILGLRISRRALFTVPQVIINRTIPTMEVLASLIQQIVVPDAADSSNVDLIVSLAGSADSTSREGLALDIDDGTRSVFSSVLSLAGITLLVEEASPCRCIQDGVVQASQASSVLVVVPIAG